MKMSVSPLEIPKCNLGVSYLEVWNGKTQIRGGKNDRESSGGSRNNSKMGITAEVFVFARLREMKGPPVECGHGSEVSGVSAQRG